MSQLETLVQKVEEDPHNPHLLYLLGQAYTGQNQFDKALEVLTDALLVADKAFASVIQPAVEQVAALKAQQAAVSQPVGTPSLTVLDGGKNATRDPLAQAELKRVTFQDVGGMDQVKAAIEMKIIKPLLHPDLFAQFGQKSGGGILLYGPPGCGKTYIAKAAANESRAAFINLRITDVLDKWIGESERNLENIFVKARSQRPAIIFVDEIDMLGYSRTKLNSDGLRGVVDHMLSELEGVDSDNEGILIIGASNVPWDIDSALKRPGRFDKTIFVSPPDSAARAAIFQLNTAGLPTDALDFEQLASRTEFFSGADIVGVIKKTAEQVLQEILKGAPQRKITQLDLLDTINTTRPSTLEWLRTMSDYIRYSTIAGQYEEVQQYLSLYKGRI